jgi:UDP-glucose 4-epimerase
MDVLITGGAGFIGSNLAEALVKEHNITILDNFQSGSMENLNKLRKEILILRESCNDSLSLGLKPDLIFHLGIPSSSPMYKSDPLLFGEAINGMISVMELAKRSGTRKVIFASSSSLYNGVPVPHKEDAEIPVSDYYTEARLAIERIAELYHRLFDLDYAGLRFFSVYGPHEEAKGQYANMVTQFLREMQMNRSPVIYGNGEQTRDFTYVKDVVDALILASKSGTGIFNVGTGKAHSFNHVVEILNEKLEKNISPEYRENPIKNYVMHTQADTSKMKRWGFNPRFSLQEGIDRITLRA